MDEDVSPGVSKKEEQKTEKIKQNDKMQKRSRIKNRNEVMKKRKNKDTEEDINEKDVLISYLT